MFRLKRNTLLPCEELSGANQLCALAIMTKAPRPGHVKTRLTPPLTAEEAVALNICFLRDTAAAIGKAGEATRGIACYSPVGAEAAYQGVLPGDFPFIAQRGTDLGERLTLATEDLLAVGFSSVCLIGSDSPTVPASTYREAVKNLSRPKQSVVLGPTHDGGYYLIGAKAVHRRLFEKIDWSTGSVLKQTLEKADELELPVDLLPTALDVDDCHALHQLCHELMEANGPTDEIKAPATTKFLRAIIAREGRKRIWPAKAVT